MIESEFVSFGEHGRVKLVNLGDEGLRRVWSMKPILAMRVFDGNDLVRFIAVKCGYAHQGFQVMSLLKLESGPSIFTRYSIRALEAREEVLPHAEELHIVKRCIHSLAMKACADPSLFRRLILAVGMKGIKPESIAGSIIHYVKKHLPLLGRQSSFKNGNHVPPGSTISAPSDADQRNLLEEIVELLPDHKIGAQLDQAALEDLLIPNMGYSVETLYDIDCVQWKDTIDSNFIVDEGQLVEGSHSLTPMTMVANLVDGYLAEVASDANLKLPKFQSLAAGIPDYARPLDDGIYHAIDIYLKDKLDIQRIRI
ncbi:hypothetical protein EZV62_004726 [Acer yangbiense]|uniref:NPH3 domain-containing protein n=1 Tax=Acer yangbiense TaxID=1000413 RepID=A0A5C7IKQ9_9ROSI|nr:hypothetical protein EZV62_004726 [Acer yangbiense]